MITSSGTYTNEDRISLHMPAAKLNTGRNFSEPTFSPRPRTPSYPMKNKDFEGIADRRTIPTPENNAFLPSTK